MSKSKSKKSNSQIKEESAMDLGYESIGKSLDIGKIKGSVSGETVVGGLDDLTFKSGNSPRTSPRNSPRRSQVVESDSDDSVDIKNITLVSKTPNKSPTRSPSRKNTLDPNDYGRKTSLRTPNKTKDNEKILITDSDTEVDSDMEEKPLLPSMTKSRYTRMQSEEVPRSRLSRVEDEMEIVEKSGRSPSRMETQERVGSSRRSPSVTRSSRMEDEEVPRSRSSRMEIEERVESSRRSPSRIETQERVEKTRRSPSSRMEDEQVPRSRSSRMDTEERVESTRRSPSGPRSTRMEDEQVPRSRSSRMETQERVESTRKTASGPRSSRMEDEEVTKSRTVSRRTDLSPKSKRETPTIKDIEKGADVASSRREKTFEFESDSESDDSSVEVTRPASRQVSRSVTRTETKPVSRSMTRPVSRSVTRTETRTFSNDDEIADNLDNFLIEKNILVLDTLVSEVDGSPRVLFIKASNYLGQIFLIRTENGGTMTGRKSKTIVLNEIIQGKLVPTSMKVDISKCAGSAVCGVAFQCKDEFCYLYRNNEGEFDEISFKLSGLDVFDNKYTGDAKVLIGDKIGNKVFAYPIVTIDEIRTNTVETFVNVKNATERIQKHLVKDIHNGFDDLDERLNLLKERIKAVHKNYDQMFKQLGEETKQGMNLMKKLDGIPIKNSEEQAKQKETSDYLLLKTVTFNKIVEKSGKFITDLSRDVDIQLLKVSDLYYGGYLVTKETFDENISGGLRKASSWNLPDKFDKMSLDEILSKRWVTDNDPNELVSLANAIVG